MDYPRLQHPFLMYVVGASQTGKTDFTIKLIQNTSRVIDKPIDRILFCYTIWQSKYEPLWNDPRVVFFHGCPTMEFLEEEGIQLVVLDDLMNSKECAQELMKLATAGVHHITCSVIYLAQNLYHSKTRTSRVNAQYLVMFRNPADNLQIQSLARQLYPKTTHFLIDSFRDATADKPYSYMLIDLHVQTPEFLRLRTRILPGEEPMFVYAPRKV